MAAAQEQREGETSSGAAEEARELRAQVQRLKLERKLYKVVSKVALAIAADMISGEHPKPSSLQAGCVRARLLSQSLLYEVH